VRSARSALRSSALSAKTEADLAPDMDTHDVSISWDQRRLDATGELTAGRTPIHNHRQGSFVYFMVNFIQTAPNDGRGRTRPGLGTSTVEAVAKQLDAGVEVLSSAQGMAVSITHATRASPCPDSRALFPAAG
jgi:two-component sensor histidine kinase